MWTCSAASAAGQHERFQFAVAIVEQDALALPGLCHLSLVHARKVHGHLQPMMLRAIEIQRHQPFPVREYLGAQPQGVPADAEAVAGVLDEILLRLQSQVGRHDHVAPGVLFHRSSFSRLPGSRSQRRTRHSAIRSRQKRKS